MCIIHSQRSYGRTGVHFTISLFSSRINVPIHDWMQTIFFLFLKKGNNSSITTALVCCKCRLLDVFISIVIYISCYAYFYIDNRLTLM